VGFGTLYNFVTQSSIFTLLSPISHFHLFKSSSTCSSHLILGLPTGLHEHGSHSVSFLTVLIVSILITCAVQRNSTSLYKTSYSKHIKRNMFKINTQFANYIRAKKM